MHITYELHSAMWTYKVANEKLKLRDFLHHTQWCSRKYLGTGAVQILAWY